MSDVCQYVRILYNGHLSCSIISYLILLVASLSELILFAGVEVLGLELRAFTLSHSTSPFCDGYFLR
jgi:hypothetical protein